MKLTHPPPPDGWEGESEKGQIYRLRQEQVNSDTGKYNNKILIVIRQIKREREREIKAKRNKWCTVELLTTHVASPKQWSALSGQFPPSLYTEHNGMEYPFGHFGQ